MKVNFAKLSQLEWNTNSEGYFGFFETKEDFKKLVAYGKSSDKEPFEFLWIHKDYLA